MHRRRPDSRPRLGLVCMTAGDEVRYRTITRTRLRSLEPAVQVDKLRELYADNARRLGRAIDFCLERGISLYRLSSGLFPQGEEPPGFELLEELGATLGEIGNRASSAGMRLVMHPDQFIVLSSDTPSVIENSIVTLCHQARVLDLLRQPRSPWAAIQLHGGKGGRGERLIGVIAELPDPIRSRLALENDESAYSAAEILTVCRAAGVPMVFDAHHHLVHEKLPGYDHPDVEAFTAAARETWPEPEWQLVHISNGRDALHDAKHADFVDVMPESFRNVPWIEVEAKQKDLALARLEQQWR